MDVYSVGICFCEMATGKPPDQGRRANQIQQVQNLNLRQLIQRCVEQRPENRPSMLNIINILQGIIDDELAFRLVITMR